MKYLTYALAGLGIVGLGVAGYQLATGKSLFQKPEGPYEVPLKKSAPLPTDAMKLETTRPDMTIMPVDIGKFVEV
jgi:hypothetical protein